MPTSRPVPEGLVDFISACIAAYRPLGLFSAPLFDDVAEVIGTLDREFDILEPVVGSERGETYTVLLALDTETAVYVNLRNIGTYRQTVADMLSCLADDVVVDEEGLDGIVTLHAKGRLKASTPDVEPAHFDVTQSFAPNWPWSDAFFVEQMLGRALEAGAVRCFRTTGPDPERAVYVFPPHENGADVLRRFEVEHLEDWERSRELLPENLPDLPQPTPDTIKDLYEELGLDTVRDKDMDLEYVEMLTAEYRRKANVKPSKWQVGYDWFVRVLWVVVILYVIRVVLLLAFGVGLNWPT